MTKTHGYVANKPALHKRLNRIEGQVRGVATMVDKDTYCIDVLTQIAAVRSALDQVAVELVRDHASHCMAETGSDPAVKANELADAMRRLLK